MAFDIKVCGLTRPQDVRLAAELGARFLGFVFYPESPRCVTPSHVAEMLRDCPSTASGVGVFVGEEADLIMAVCRSAGLQAAQIHRCPPGTVGILQQNSLKVIEAFSISSAVDWDVARACTADFVLADHAVPGKPGGTGQRFDWSLRPGVPMPNLILAGGLTADNVAEGMRLFTPVAVDVNSGVEDQPGIKSESKLREFFAKCQSLQEVVS